MYCEHKYLAKEDVSNFCESLVIRQISPSKVNDVHYEESKPTKFYLVKVLMGNLPLPNIHAIQYMISIKN